MADDEYIELRIDNPEEASDDDDEEGEPILYAEDDENIVAALKANKRGEEWLKEAVDDILGQVEAAFENTEEYRERKAKDWKLFTGDLPSKSAPFEGCANLHVPIMLENLVTITFQMHAELFADWSNVFQVVPTGPEYDLIAEVMTTHGNWQIREQIPDFRRQIGHRGLLAFTAHGDVTCHSYFDPVRRINRHEILTPDEFVTPYSHVTTMPDYSDLPWYVKIIRRYRHEIEAMRSVWHGVDEVLKKGPSSWLDEPESPGESKMAETHRIEIPDSGDDPDAKTQSTPWRLYHWEGWLRLPPSDDMEREGDEDIEPEERWCQAIIEPRSRACLQLQIYEQPDWQDVERAKNQRNERDDYFAARASLDQEMAAREAQISELRAAQDQARELGDLSLDQDAEGIAILEQISTAPLPPMPPAPAWMMDTDDPSEEPPPPRMVPIRLFAHGVNIEPLSGNLGIGHGRMLSDFNRGANTAFNQFSDQATLGNTKTLITTQNIEFEGGRFSVGPGKVVKLKRVTGSELKSNIMPLDFGAANPQLLETVDRMHQYGKEAAHAPGVLQGEPGKSGEPFKAQASRLEQATKILSVPTGKYLEFVEQILKNNALLNSKNLPDEEIQEITNVVTRQSQRIIVRRDMFERSYNVSFRCDLKFKTDAQRIAEADEAVKLGMQHPILQASAPYQWYSLKKSLEARGRYDLVQFLPPPPKQGMPMMMYMASIGAVPPQQPTAPQQRPGGPAGQRPPQEPPPGSRAAPPPVARPPAPPNGPSQ